MEIRQWRKLERHPLSAEYDDIGGEAWNEYLTGVREFGVVNDRRIVIFEGKVLDGWQLQRACVETDTKPKYKDLKLPRGMLVDQWVEIVNDNRRHEDMAMIRGRKLKRLERVAEARRAGESFRSIAEKEKVSERTIRTDVAELEADGVKCEPEDGKVKGKDNVARPATQKPKAEPDDNGEYFSPAKPEIPARLRNRSAAQQPLPSHQSLLKPKAQIIVDAVHSVFEAMRQAVECSDQVIRATMEKQRGKLELIMSDVDMLLDKPLSNGKVSREQRNLLFDALADITGTDKKSSAAYIGKVVNNLVKAEPAYTPEEVHQFEGILKREFPWMKGRITLTTVDKYIGVVRSKKSEGGEEFASLKRFVERGRK